MERQAAPAIMTALAVSILAAPGARAAEPRLQDVLSAVTLSFGSDGAFDRAVLTQSDDGADLAIYRGVPAPEKDAPTLKPVFTKAGLVWSGQMWGTLPSLSVNGRGSLVVSSENDAIGRDRWHQALTIAYRDGRFVVVGITHDSRDTLDPKAGGSCDLNLATGQGSAMGRPVTFPAAPIPLADWSDDRLPKLCGD